MLPHDLKVLRTWQFALCQSSAEQCLMCYQTLRWLVHWQKAKVPSSCSPLLPVSQLLGTLPEATPR